MFNLKKFSNKRINNILESLSEIKSKYKRIDNDLKDLPTVIATTDGDLFSDLVHGINKSIIKQDVEAIKEFNNLIDENITLALDKQDSKLKSIEDDIDSIEFLLQRIQNSTDDIISNSSKIFTKENNYFSARFYCNRDIDTTTLMTQAVNNSSNLKYNTPISTVYNNEYRLDISMELEDGTYAIETVMVKKNTDFNEVDNIITLELSKRTTPTIIDLDIKIKESSDNS